MADDLSTSKFLFAGVRVHCVVLEKQLLPLRPLVGVWLVRAGWSRRVTAVIASRKRPVPFRTRKLSSIAPMVLHSGGCGRVGRRRTSSSGRVEDVAGILVRVSRRPRPSLFSCPIPGPAQALARGELTEGSRARRQLPSPSAARRQSLHNECALRPGVHRAEARESILPGSCNARRAGCWVEWLNGRGWAEAVAPH